jgi:hypothetical protein
MMAGKNELIQAIRKQDAEALQRLGWTNIANTLRGISARTFGWPDLEPYAQMWHHRDPDEIEEAIRQVVTTNASNGYRPTAAQLAPHLATHTGTNLPAPLRPAQQPTALQQAKQLITDGHPICQCTPSPTNLRSTRGVLTCNECKGIDQGQADDALEQPE